MSAHDAPAASSPSVPSPRPPAASTLARRQVLALIAALTLPIHVKEAVAAAPERLIDLLYNLAWVPDGAPSAKHAYVVFAPWCPACKHLFKNSRSLVSKMQLRWIPAGSRTAEWRRYNATLGLSRDVQQLTALWAGGRNPNAEPRRFTSVDLNEGVIVAYTPDISEIVGRAFGFPTVIYRDAAGVKAFNGVPANFAARLEAAVTNAGYPVDGSKSIALLRRPISEMPLLDGQHAHGRRPATLRALPFEDAPAVGAMRGGDSRLALAEIATDGGRWIAVAFSRGDLRAYVPRADVDLRAA
jgi:hypothetical protein